ncbi:MAG: phenylalanine--tRNA ligase subunit beta [Bacillota bacterium]|nr:phenylalanine--tRNA ligase subunit beta [Bacillota bacterium]
MGVSVNWLKDYVEIDWTAEELMHRLTMAGIAIEAVEQMDDDELLVLDLTPNRGDCLGMINIAREIAALERKEIRIPATDFKVSTQAAGDQVSVSILDEDLCKRFAARMIKNVQVKESPEWLQERLIHSGIRPINNIVDVTNFVMLETNQPMHAYDYELLDDQHNIIVRRARPGEKLTTLDDVERVLEGDMLLITDNNRPIGLAGVMGGQSTEINDNTVDVLLEAACFHPGNIRRTSRKTALRSDASMRFEKGADINGVIYALNRAASLLQEIAGGEVLDGIVDVYPDPQVPRQVVLRPGKVNDLLGTQLSAEQIKGYIQKLKFKVSEEDGQFTVIVPSYRPDIEFEADLIEEVARLYGYDNIPTSLPAGASKMGGLTPYQRFKENVRSFFARYLNEIINYSFVSPRYLDMLDLSPADEWRTVINVANPLSEEQSIMRTHLLGGLLDTVSRNLARKNNSLAFFEIGSVFIPVGDELPEEVLKAGGIVAGRTELNWLQSSVEMDFYFLKGIVEQLFENLGIEQYQFVELSHPAYHPGRSASILCQGELLGVIGEIHPVVRQNFGIKPRACAFDLDMAKMYKLSSRRRMMEQITRYPAVERDLAILVKEEIKASQVVELIRKSGGELLQKVIVFDLYAGEQVAKGSKSIAFRLVFQSPERTLTEDEVNTIIEQTLQKLKDELQAELR